MKVKTKLTIFIIFAFLLASLSILLSYHSFRTQLAVFEREILIEEYKIVNNNVELVRNELDFFLSEYAFWDDMYDAVLIGDVTWIKKTLTNSLTNYQADVIWIIAADGSVLYAEQTDPARIHTLPVDLNQLSTLKNINTVKQFSVWNQQTLTGYRAGPIVPITADRKDSPAAGYMVVGRDWNQQLFEKIVTSQETSLNLMPGTAAFIDSRISATEFLDWGGTPIAHLQITHKDRAVNTLNTFAMYQILLGISLSVVFILVSWIVFQRWFIHPIKQINQLILSSSSVEGFEKERLHKLDEFSALKWLINDYVTQTNLVVYKNNKLNEARSQLQETLQKLKKELRNSKKFSLITESSTDSIVITDASGNIEYVNPAWVKLTGYNSADVVGKNPRILQSGKTPSEIYPEMWQQLLQGKPFITEEIINRRKDGSFYNAFLSVYPVMEEDRVQLLVGIQRDISKRIQLDQIKSEFISLASHQLRTPLSAIRWFIELLLQEQSGTLNEKQKGMIQNLYESTLRMIALVSNLLNIYRIESGRLIIKPVPTNLIEVLEKIIIELEPLFKEKQLIVEKKLPASVSSILTDKGLLAEVYVNLLTNAVKYTPNGGTIQVEIIESTDTILSKISDTGYGIPAREKEQIFGKFFRASNVSGVEVNGTGLGLYLTKSIVESCKGTIDFESEEGKGSTFWFTIPKADLAPKEGTVNLSSSLTLD